MFEAIGSSLDITPRTTVSVAANGPINTPSTGVGFPLEANIVGLRESGHVLMIVTVDWFFCSPTLRRRVLAKCAGRLQETELIIAASHTHSSPNPDPTKVAFSDVDTTYVDLVETAIAERVSDLLAAEDWLSAQLRYSSVTCDHAMHRRRRGWVIGGGGLRRGTGILPNPKGPRDNELRLLRVECTSGTVIAILWGFSCHPTDWPRKLEISSDYPGGVRNALRELAGATIPVAFLQGYCGTLRPPSIGIWPRSGSLRNRIISIVSGILNGPTFVGFSEAQYMKWLSSIADCAREALEHTRSAVVLKANLLLRRNEIATSDLGIKGVIDKLGVQSVRIGETLFLIAISAEVCWEYAELLQRRFPHATVWPVGYTDSVFGYLPTGRMLPEGGYEVEQFMGKFGVRGKFVSNVDEIVTASLP